MTIAKSIAQEIFQVFSSGKNGIVLELDHRQELEPIIHSLQTDFFPSSSSKSAISLRVQYGVRKKNNADDLLPTFFECRSQLRPVANFNSDHLSPASYLALGLRQYAYNPMVNMIIIENFHLLPEDIKLQTSRQLLQLLAVNPQNSTALILLTVAPPDRIVSEGNNRLRQLPEELLPYVHIIRGRKPDSSELLETVNNILDQNHLSIPEDFKAEIVSYLQGFQSFEVPFLFHRAQLLYGDQTFHPTQKRILDSISSEKVKLLEQGKLLEWRIVRHVDLANMDVLKNHLRESGIIMSRLKDAQLNGVDVPKGILIMGLPGTGKSLFAQFAAAELHMPLIRLDMGKMMGGHVGDSERNLRNAQRQAEDMAPCILWIDEIEKGFAGAGNKRDEGAYLQRMTGSFLTWLQEKKSSCYIIATANSIDGLPPEFFRKGRFDECFFTAMPSEFELRQILLVHLRKPGRAHVEPAADNTITRILRLATSSQKFMTGADASALVSNTFRRLYIDFISLDQNHQLPPDQDKSAYDLAHLEEVMKAEFNQMKSFSDTNAHDLSNYYRILRKSNFINASTPNQNQQTLTNYDQRLLQFIETREETKNL